MIILKSVAWHDIDDVWPEIEPYAAQAIEHSHGTLSADAIKASIRERDMQCLVAVDEDDNIVGTLITSVHRTPTDVRYIHIDVVAGDRFDEWRSQANELLKKWAMSMDAPFIRATGRRGWTRVALQLADYGWKEEAVIMRLDLRN